MNRFPIFLEELFKLALEVFDVFLFDLEIDLKVLIIFLLVYLALIL